LDKILCEAIDNAVAFFLALDRLEVSPRALPLSAVSFHNGCIQHPTKKADPAPSKSEEIKTMSDILEQIPTFVLYWSDVQYQLR
jgi:hypothetical protein